MNIKDKNIQVLSLENLSELIYIYQRENKGFRPTHIVMHIEQYLQIREQLHRTYYPQHFCDPENPNKIKFQDVLLLASYELDEGEVLTGKMF